MPEQSTKHPNGCTFCPCIPRDIFPSHYRRLSQFSSLLDACPAQYTTTGLIHSTQRLASLFVLLAECSSRTLIHTDGCIPSTTPRLASFFVLLQHATLRALGSFLRPRTQKIIIRGAWSTTATRPRRCWRPRRVGRRANMIVYL